MIMKYEIAYVSLSGNTQKLAYGIADRLPKSQTIITNLDSDELSKNADVYLIGFGVNKGTIPLKVMDALDELNGKIILFFVTCGMELTEMYRDAVEKKLLPFMPESCDYRGLFMCQGQFSDHITQAIRQKYREDTGNKYAQRILNDVECASGHPNRADYENAVRFIRAHLG